MDKANVRVTDFQERVYAAVSEIPKGRVSTYKSIAAKLKCGSSRAVGQALRRNPYAPKVPCHRVIASDLTIGGFCGARVGKEIAKKRDLLEREGVEFVRGKLADRDRLYFG